MIDVRKSIYKHNNLFKLGFREKGKMEEVPTEPEIEKNLSQLTSGKNRAWVVLHMAGKFPVPGKFLEEAFRYLEQQKDFFLVACLAKDAGQPEKAIEAYLMIKPPRADLAAKTAEEAKMFERAVEIWDSHGYAERAIGIAERAGLLDKGIEIAGKYKKFLSGARLARKKGLEEKAIFLYREEVEDCIEAKRYADGARAVEEAGIKDMFLDIFYKAGEECEKKKQYITGAEFFKKAGQDERANGAYIKAMEELENEKRFDDMAAFADWLGMPEKANAYRAIYKLVK